MRNIILSVVIFHLFHGCVLMEFPCERPDWFKCNNGRCISHFFECDSEDDCGDFSDERDCAKFEFKPDAKCRPGEFRCLDNMCISEEFVCDGHNDCMDSSDEILGCSKGKECDGFKCKNGYCVLKEWKCDGSNDCGDNSDEEDCFHKLTPKECTPQKGYFLCESQECISLINACDNKNDCPDASDENIIGCKNALQQCSVNGTCDHICNKTPKGAVCSCRPGYELIRDRICVDINECDIYGICDQNCENLDSTYKCSCEDGYVLQNDSRTCKADAGEALMIYSSKTDIRGLYLTSQVMFYVARKLQHVVGVSLDADYVYWSNVQVGNEVIVRSKEDGSQKEVIVTAGLGAPEDIAVDWVTGNVYFTDGQMKHVAVCTHNGSTCTVIVKEATDKPRGISLLPSKGEMYWSDWGEKPHISKAHMDGTNITPFITKDIVWPNGLTIDYQSHRLYWVDAKLSTIETVKLDGTDRRVVVHSVAKHPYSIAIFENKLYWSDWETNSIQSCNKFTGKGHATVVKEKKSIYGIHIYHSTLKPKMANPCSHGLCSDICLLAPNSTYSCGCPADKELSDDKHNCRLTQKEKKIMVGAGHMFIEVHHEVLGKPKLSAYVLYQDITALAYDPETGTIFASDRLKNVIFRYNPTTHEITNLITTKIGHVGGMDFDHLGRNLYWCDTIFKKIEVYSMHTGQRITIYSEPLEEVPLALAVIPEYGLLYIVFKSRDHIHIDKMQMSGRGSKTHVIESGLLGPSVAITYDDHLGRIFWADEGTGMIESTSFDGKDRHQFRSNLNSPTSLAIVGNEIFWTTYDSLRLYWADKTGDIPGEKKITLGLPPNMGKMYLVRMAGNSGLSKAHSCLDGNGGCSHVCLVVTDQLHTCSCPSEMTLDHDNSTCVTHRSCKVYETKCESDNSCIDKLKWCNGLKDCPNGEDEADCHKPVICGIDHFACKNGECIHNSKLCDLNYDCADRSDEEDCSLQSCKKDEFQCKRGNCITKYSVCDGRKDCADGSDEENCQEHTCDPKSSFTCKTGGCIPKSWECDGQVDCEDGSDEFEQCAARSTCDPKMFTCSNSRCVDKLLVCDLADDCGDGSDEQHCSNPDKEIHVACGEDEFRCMETDTCLSIDARCNGVVDCPMKDDELLCTDCELSEFTCANEKCIPRAWVCDRVDDCGDKSDEENCESHVSEPDLNNGKSVLCDEYRCLTGKCIPFTSVCNGNPDCYDHSDEDGNCDTSCGPTNPCKGICHKTPSGPVCGCAEGYELQSDGYSCEDIDECKLEMCPQVCRNTMGSYSCSCFNGFYGDGHICKATGSPMEIIMATRNDIRKMSQSLKSVEVIYTLPDFGVTVNCIDSNIARKMVYWSEDVTGTIYQLSLETKQIKNVTKIGNPRVLSVDWITDNVYFYDSENQHSIKVCNLEERKCAHVISVDSGAVVSALVVDPQHGFIFWGQTEPWSYNDPTSAIYRADMTGKNRNDIASNKVGVVSGFAIDHLRGRLYWADQHLQLVESSDLNGGDRRNLFHIGVHRPADLVLFEDSLYWLHRGTGQITVCSLFAGNQTCNKMKTSSSQNEKHFTIMHQTRQPIVENTCKNHNCSHMCVINNPYMGCLCPNGTIVSLDEKCVNVTRLTPEFGDTSNNSKAEGSYVAGVITTLFVCLALMGAYYCYQQRKKDSNSKCDMSIRFQNPGFGCQPATNHADTIVLPPGEHEYVNPIVDIRSKFPRDDTATAKRTIQINENEDLITSGSEDGNYHPNARLID